MNEEVERINCMNSFGMLQRCPKAISTISVKLNNTGN